MRGVKYFALIAWVMVLASACFAASQNAVVMGGVYDATGKGKPGVRVVLDNAALGFEREATTGDDGGYTIQEVPPHDGYRITAYKGADRMDARSGLAVTVGEEKNILPPLHELPVVAAGTQVVERKAEAISNETTSTMISGVISGEQLRTLPLFNRNFLALGLLSPNSHDVEAGSALAGATFSVAGGRPNTNMFLLDGTDNVARSSNQAIPFQVNDAVQEFRVISATSNAEYGDTSGGVVNIVTQRGSNQLHGSVFGYFANDGLSADNPISVYGGTGFDKAATYAGPVGATTTASNINFGPTTYNNYVANAAFVGFCTDSIGRTNVAGTHACAATGGFGKNTKFDPAAILSTNDSRTQPFDSRQFGINLGGPIKKDKLFFFGSYEGTRIDNPNQIFERVPSSFDKTYNPLLAANVPTALPFFFTATNPNYLFAQRILNLYPAPNVVAVPNALEFYRGEAPNYTNVDNGILHVDFAQSKSTNWSIRYASQALNQLHDDTLPTSAIYPGNGAVRDAFNQNLVLTQSHQFGSGLVTETRAGVTRFRVNETAQDAGFPVNNLGLPTKQMMTFSLAGLDPQYSGATWAQTGAFANWIDSYWLTPPAGFPAADILNSYPTLSNQFPFARIGAPLSAPGTRRDTTWLLGEGVSWSKGRHVVKVGGGFRSFQNNLSNGGFARGLLTSSNIGEFTSDSMSCIFCVVINEPAFQTPSFDYAVRQPTPYGGRFSSFAWEGFAQDTWKIHPRVTINAGLRYDYFSQPNEANHQTFNFDPLANGLIQSGTNTVVDPYGQACAPVEPYLSVYLDNAGSLGWKCNKTGNGAIAGKNPGNMGPRLGFAWDVRGNGNTVVRAGAGWFFSQSPSSYVSQLIFNRPSVLNINSQASLNNPPAIYGTNFNSSWCLQCGFGNTTVNPASLANGSLGQQLLNLFQSASSPLPIYASDFLHSATPYTQQISVTVQQKVSGHLVAEVGYIGSASNRLPVVNNVGFNNEWFCNVSSGCDALNPVFMLSNQGESNYHSLMTRVRMAQYHGLTLNGTYTWSKSMDNASSASFPLVPVTLQNQLFGVSLNGLGTPLGGATINGVQQRTGQNFTPTALSSDVLSSGLTTTGLGQILVSHYGLPQDPNHFLRDDYGRSDFNVANRLVVDYTWDVPIFASGRAANWLGRWKLSGITDLQSGQPFTVFSSIGGEVTQRANLANPVVINGSDPSQYINSSAFHLAAFDKGCARNFGVVSFAKTTDNLFSGVVGQPCTGNTARNQFTGPGYANTDFAVQKGVQVAEGKMLTFRAEFYNLFNRANYYNPISQISADGLTKSDDFGKIKSAHQPFQVQLAARFTF